MVTETILWNAALSFLTGLGLWLIKVMWDEMQRLQVLLNKTREEIARENVTQSEIDKIVAHIDGRFDKLNDKIDSFIKEQRSAF